MNPVSDTVGDVRELVDHADVVAGNEARRLGGCRARSEDELTADRVHADALEQHAGVRGSAGH